ncbi:MAG: FmdB family zinc ribbon protein [Candidatus Omnitrophota bacterium]
MPTYEYECTQCGHSFEAFQKMTDQHLDKCPECGGKPRRLISSGAGFIFKGAGFYATDYRKKPVDSAEKADKPACPKANEGCKGCPQAS